ncbi:phage tail protein [Halobacteriales archaeon QS_8_69_26]|nr:MAG: phage tail protein [Halobacteriales archaeon QS_8_69_26]
MPEYLSPGVYVEEVDAGAKAVEGVSTSTAAFLGPTERGPVEPRLVTSWGQFTRIYGKSPGSNLDVAVDGFFKNGGARAYITRVTPDDPDDVAKATVTDGSGDPVMDVGAIGPGDWANTVAIIVEDSAMYTEGENQLFDVTVRYWSKDRDEISEPASADPSPSPDASATYDELTPDPSSSSHFAKQMANDVLVDVEAAGDGRPETGITWLGDDSGGNNSTNGSSSDGDDEDGIPDDDELDDMTYNELRDLAEPYDIDRTQKKDEIKEDLQRVRDSGEAATDGGTDELSLSDYQGQDITGERTGMAALKEHDNVSLVVVPDENDIRGLTEAVVTHCENQGDRFAVLSCPQNAGRVSNIHTPVDSSYAAYYYPWIETKDPITNEEKVVPPAGHMAGIYARNDNTEGVWGSPANMVVRGALDLQHDITKGEQDVLNPRGVNCIRAFQGRGIRVWGARTCSSDPSWKYINVRRLFLFIEQSIEEGTQWAVFEANDRELWDRVEQSVRMFLTTVWRDGGLMGTSPDEAFFVNCGESTMTQDDIENGRLICEIGVAPVKPAEFVIFRIQQWTEEAAP